MEITQELNGIVAGLNGTIKTMKDEQTSMNVKMTHLLSDSEVCDLFFPFVLLNNSCVYFTCLVDSITHAYADKSPI